MVFHPQVMGDLSAKDTASMGFSIALCGRSMDDDHVTRSSANKKKYQCTVSGTVPFSKELFFGAEDLELHSWVCVTLKSFPSLHIGRIIRLRDC